MELVGVDMTSAPGPRKPITVARGRLAADVVTVEQLDAWPSWGPYEALLAGPGPWVAAVDHPFGLPRAAVAALGWPAGWAEYVAGLDRFPDRAAFKEHVRVRIPTRPRRATDRRTRAQSPLNTVNPPVGLMFFEGATRLLAAGVDVRPCRPRPRADRVAVEGYPRLVARALIADRRYKGGPSVEGNVTAAARAALIDALTGDTCQAAYGVTVEVGRDDCARIVHDWSGDLLDAVLCLAQAAWAHGRRADGFGVPAGADPDEGWIVDPSTAAPPPAPT